MSAVIWPVLHNNSRQYDGHTPRYRPICGTKTAVHASKVSPPQHNHTDSPRFKKSKHLNKNFLQKTQPKTQVSRTEPAVIIMLGILLSNGNHLTASTGPLFSAY